MNMIHKYGFLSYFWNSYGIFKRLCQSTLQGQLDLVSNVNSKLQWNLFKSDMNPYKVNNSKSSLFL